MNIIVEFLLQTTPIFVLVILTLFHHHVQVMGASVAATNNFTINEAQPNYSIPLRSFNQDSCNSSDDILRCGTIEYIGCTGSKRFYHESAIKMTWFEAWEYCRAMGLHLAAIESRYEQTFIELFLPPLGVTNTETYWTSGTDLGKEGLFSWMATGRGLTYGNFRPGEPNNRFGSENCLELVIKPGVVGYLWNDRNCFGKGYVVCQHDLRYPDKPSEDHLQSSL